MLNEIFHYYATPCPKAHRSLGYLSGLIAIQACYQRVAEQWQPHLENSQQLILQAASQTAQRRKIVVLGSGLLKDVPVEALAKQFDSVILIDIAHLIGARYRCMKLDNIVLLEHDITGLAEALVSYQTGIALPRPNAQLPNIALDADLIISCNMLSQLAITPSQYLQQHFTIDVDQLINWQQAIIIDHLSLLADQSGRRVLLCDAYHDYLDDDNKLLKREEVLHGINVGEAEQQWRWLIAPLGELDKQYQLQSTVLGFSDWSLPTVSKITSSSKD